MLRAALLFAMTLLIASCGGGGGEGSPASPAAVPSGTWFGALEDPASTMRTFSITTSGNSITVNDAPTGRTGTLAPQSASIFSFTLSDGTRGALFLDSARTHAVFLDEDFNFGVVQLGATAPLPAFAHADLNGAWSGVTITTNFTTFTPVASSANCAVPTCTTADSGVTTTATFTVTNFDAFGGPTFGRWLGTYTASDNSSGSMRAFLSPDKQFAGTWRCPGADLSSGCRFTAWRR